MLLLQVKVMVMQHEIRSNTGKSRTCIKNVNQKSWELKRWTRTINLYSASLEALKLMHVIPHRHVVNHPTLNEIDNWLHLILNNITNVHITNVGEHRQAFQSNLVTLASASLFGIEYKHHTAENFAVSKPPCWSAWRALWSLKRRLVQPASSSTALNCSTASKPWA